MYEHTDIYVAEVSSYQLELCDKFSPNVACLLNITPDHIEWHGSFDNYRNAKLKVFDHAKNGVINVDDEEVSNNLSEIKNQVEDDLIINTFNNDVLSVNYHNINHEIIEIKNMRIIGQHNCVNARAAASICMILGLSDAQISAGIESFVPLEHRLEPCGIIAGVRIYNDSKATNVDSVLCAIDAFEPQKAIFMMGGHDKNTSLDALVEKSIKNLKAVIVYGEAKERFHKAFSEKLKENSQFILDYADNMERAFQIALNKSYPGDFIVLSPACSSFDEFENFEERGQVFKKLVEKCK